MDKKELVEALKAVKEAMGEEFDNLSKDEKIAAAEMAYSLKEAIEARASELVEVLKEDTKNASEEELTEAALKIATEEVGEAVMGVEAEKELAYQLGAAQGAGFAAGFKAAMEELNE